MKIINAILTLSILAGSQIAKADGFKCEILDGDLNITVYNKTSANEGTRNAAVMVLSNPAVGAGNKTIAKFTDAHATLASSELTYVGKVDLRFNDSKRKGEALLDTKLGYVDLVILSLDFSYGYPKNDGDGVSGTLTVVKRDGEESFYEASCVRYLKTN